MPPFILSSLRCSARHFMPPAEEECLASASVCIIRALDLTQSKRLVDSAGHLSYCDEVACSKSATAALEAYVSAESSDKPSARKHMVDMESYFQYKVACCRCRAPHLCKEIHQVCRTRACGPVRWASTSRIMQCVTVRQKTWCRASQKTFHGVAL